MSTKKGRPKKHKVESIGKELNIYEVSSLKDKLNILFSENDTVELDLGEVEKCDTAGIQLLYSAKISAEVMNKQFITLNPTECIKEKLLQMGLDPESTFN